MTSSQSQMKKVPLLDLQAQYETIRDDVRSAVDRVFDSQHFVLGAEVQALEEEIARYSQTKFAIGCASGSDALLLALMSCDVAAGDEVITSPVTDIGTVIGVIFQHAVPVFADLVPNTYNLDPADVERKARRVVREIHIYENVDGRSGIDPQPGRLPAVAKYRAPDAEVRRQAAAE